MSHSNDVECILCRQSEENKTTGPLSTKDNVTAHQNCLLYSSGIACQDSPQFDDLFGFSAKDVMKEVQRGRKLFCNKCKKKGATVGCENKICKKSYHYPCAIQAGARTFEDQDEGTFGLYCLYCHQKTQNNTKKSNGATSSLVYCHGCENAEGNIKKDSKNVTMSHCKKHAPSTSSGNNDLGLSDEDSNLSSTSKWSSKRRLDFGDQQETKVTKRSKRIISDDSSNSDVTDAEMPMFTLLDSDSEENAHTTPDEVIRKSPVAATGSSSDNPEVNKNNAKNDASVGQSEANSESLLLLLEATEVTIDSSDFWKGCNSAGCTRAIFSDFIKEMKDIFTRITSEQASQQDCDVAFKVMMASGKLGELVTQQQKVLEKQLTEIQQAATALNKVAEVLNR